MTWEEEVQPLTPEEAVELLDALDQLPGRSIRDGLHWVADQVLLAVLLHFGQDGVVRAYMDARHRIWLRPNRVRNAGR